MPCIEAWVFRVCVRPSTDCELYSRVTSGASEATDDGALIGTEYVKSPDWEPTAQCSEPATGGTPSWPACDCWLDWTAMTVSGAADDGAAAAGSGVAVLVGETDGAALGSVDGASLGAVLGPVSGDVVGCGCVAGEGDADPLAVAAALGTSSAAPGAESDPIETVAVSVPASRSFTASKSVGTKQLGAGAGSSEQAGSETRCNRDAKFPPERCRHFE
jgi:hypothetical protein